MRFAREVAFTAVLNGSHIASIGRYVRGIGELNVWRAIPNACGIDQIERVSPRSERTAQLTIDTQLGKGDQVFLYFAVR